MRSSVTLKITEIIHRKRKKKGDESAVSSGLILLTLLMQKQTLERFSLEHYRKTFQEIIYFIKFGYDMVTTRGLSNMSGTKMTLNCQNITGMLQVLIKFQPSNGPLSEKYTVTQNQISVSYI